jgi:hypothetical protein
VTARPGRLARLNWAHNRKGQFSPSKMGWIGVRLRYVNSMRCDIKGKYDIRGSVTLHVSLNSKDKASFIEKMFVLVHSLYM